MAERLDGHREIREYIDPKMSRSYYFKEIAPKIRPVLMTRTYAKNNKSKVFTYKNLLQARLLEIENI